MKKSSYLSVSLIVLAAFFIISTSCQKNESEKTINITNKVSDSINKKRNIPVGLQKLLKAYPLFLERADSNNLYWKDGTVMIYDDGLEKAHEEKLENPDLEDMMSQEYIPGKNWKIPPDVNFEPGRIRYEPFFNKMYGKSESEVKKNLIAIIWLPNIANAKVMVSKVNALDEKFKALSEDLEKISPELKKFIKKTAGTFNYRVISGTKRLSTHAYGIAIDINTDFSDYWRWDKSMKYKNRIPMEIVEIFENHGFVWGGKWYHYDTMHFEYRPELIIKLR